MQKSKKQPTQPKPQKRKKKNSGRPTLQKEKEAVKKLTLQKENVKNFDNVKSKMKQPLKPKLKT